MGKQMEGDNVERRKRAKEAREEGKDPSGEMVTLGASKQHATLPTREDASTRKAGSERGKR